jgi:hypothetical protein
MDDLNNNNMLFVAIFDVWLEEENLLAADDIER